MRRYHWVRLYALLLMIIMFAMTMAVSVRSALVIYKVSSRQKGIVRSIEHINGASDAIINAVSSVASAAGRDQYSQLLELISVEDDSRLSEKDLEGYFKIGYCNKITDSLGKDSATICEGLNSFIKDSDVTGVVVSDNGLTGIEQENDDAGIPTALRIKNVTIHYDDPVTGTREDTFNYDIVFPDAVFHAGNDELFRYCMVAGKGIYITGRTSSIIGDLFAGVHEADECREAEMIYGETGTYGGINILTTQVGIRADRVISKGDININGSFVVFDSNAEKSDVFARDINEISGFSKDARYTLNGEYHNIAQMDEESAQVYYDSLALISSSLAILDPASMYYDSDNDRNYSGKYRKLISGTDVELKSDFTGIVATRANVIIDKDVNFEGVILCGDRIYAMGNNNIVANPSVARTIIASENAEGEYSFRVSDYIGGMKVAGLTDPEHYVVPYK